MADVPPLATTFHDFMLTEVGLALYQYFYFQHVIQTGAPAADYLLPYATIRRLLNSRGLLLRPAARQTAATPATTARI